VVRHCWHQRQDRVNQYHPSHGGGGSAGLQQRDHPAHRVAGEYHRAHWHGFDEPVQQGTHGRYARTASLWAGEAVPGEVYREHPAGAGQQRGDRRPVHRRAGQPVDAHECRPGARPAEVEVVDGAIQVNPPRVGPHAQHLHVIAAQVLMSNRPACCRTGKPQRRRHPHAHDRGGQVGNQVTAAAQQAMHGPDSRRGTSPIK
jgi:hypothetical protein